jgi:ribonucleotide monophosphatase NagD (HAD superfamily)
VVEDAAPLVVGDSLTTDIEGARAAGYDSLFVIRGIFAGELGIEPGPELGRLLEELTEAAYAGEARTRDEAVELARRLQSR